jgi:membrane protease YdiL (CAAX protease family)
LIAEVRPDELPRLTLFFCVSGVAVLAWLVWRRLRRSPAERPEPFAALDPAVLIGVAFLVFATYGLCVGFTGPRLSFGAALGATAIGLAIAAGMWWLVLRRVLVPRAGILARIGAGLLLAWAALPLVYGLSWVVMQLSQPEMQEQVQHLSERRPGWRNVAVAAVFLAPVLEEMIFRGLLYPALRGLWNVPVAVCVTAVLFGLVHAPAAWGPMAVFGVLLAYLVESTGSLLAAIVAHTAFNALTVGQLVV